MPISVRALVALALVLLGGCATTSTPPPLRIALLAPFEGRYREVGYNALYAARLALAETENAGIELLPIDDGGTAASGAVRARALQHDPLVRVAIALGYSATSETTQQAFGDLPLVIVGHWDAQPATDGVFILANRELSSAITAPPGVEVTVAARLPAPVVGGEVFALEQFPRLRDSLEGVTVASSGAPPDPAFRDSYLNSAPFAPEPGLLAHLTYAATAAAAGALRETDASRAAVGANFASGESGFRFENGYWADAPIHFYRYNDERQLVAEQDVVE